MVSDILEKLKSQIGDDVQQIYDNEALFKLAAAEIDRLRKEVEEQRAKAARYVLDTTATKRELRTRAEAAEHERDDLRRENLALQESATDAAGRLEAANEERRLTRADLFDAHRERDAARAQVAALLEEAAQQVEDLLGRDMWSTKARDAGEGYDLAVTEGAAAIRQLAQEGR